MPGWGTRYGELPAPSIAALVGELAEELEETPPGRFALFGHSLGGLVAYSLARALLDREGPSPLLLVVSGVAAPSSAVQTRRLSTLCDEDLIDQLRTLNGTAPEILDDAEMLRHYLPMVRKDFELVESFRHQAGPPFDFPILALGGSRDPQVPPSAVRGWRKETRAQCRVRIVDGDHFFIHQRRQEVLEAILWELNSELGLLG